MNDKTFDRVEKKYLITASQEKEILNEIDSHMQKDTYFDSTIYNIYFDTKNFDLIIKSIENPKFKEKLRARSYKGYDRVYLEIKTKLRGKDYNTGYKRRVLITHEDYKVWQSGGSSLVALAAKAQETPADIQIASEIEYMIAHFDLSPKIFVRYNRKSYTGDGGLRITFDTDLRYRDEDLTFDTSENDKPYFKDDRNIIMEIKVHGAMPLWLVHTLSRTKAYPERFSKIGNIYKLIRKEQNV